MRRVASWLAVLTLMVLGAVLVCPPGSAHARVQQAPSSRVKLDLPEGFVPSPQFSGFVDEAVGASFVIVEMPAAAYDQLAKGMTAEALEAKGVRNARASTLPRTEPYVFMEAEQATPAGDYAKLMLVFRDSGVAALVTANVRKTAITDGLVKLAAIRSVLASASIASAPAPSREAFSLGYLGPFQAAGSVLGTTRAFTLDGKMAPPTRGATRPMLIVAPSLDRQTVLEPQVYAEKLLDGLPGLSLKGVDERREIRIAGMDGVEIVGKAIDKDSGAEIAVYQVLLLPAGGGYYRIVAQMPVAARDELVPELRRIAASFKPLE